MIAVGIVGLILFFFFTANHPKKRAHSPLLEAVRALRFPTPSQGIDGLLLSGHEFEQVPKVPLTTKITTTFSSQPSLDRVSVHPPDRFLFSG